GFKFDDVANREGDRFYREGQGRGVERCQIIFSVRHRCRVEQEGDPSDLRGNLLEQLQPFAAQRTLCSSKPSNVAPRPRDGGGEAAPHWIGNKHENDRDSTGLLQQGLSRRRVV